jgi:exodeoxyribonuclease VIII
MNLLDLTNEDYHNRPGVSASMLKSMARGWRTFEAEYITKTAPRKESAAMALGTAVHTALLEPERFATEYVVCPEECSDRRTKAYKEWAASVDGAAVLTTDDAATIDAIRESVRRDDFASKLLAADGYVEKSMEWNDQGVLCRMRFDKIAGPFCIDIKTCQDATPEAFAKTIASYRYDLQAAHYLSGLTNNGIGWGMRFVFIAVETASPYRVRCYEMCDDDFDKANDDRVSLLQEYRRRSKSGDWSEPGEGVLTKVFLPNWFAKREVAV